MSIRKLASIQAIEDVQPIPGADAIEKIKVLGWWVVAQKSIGYTVGDLVVYHEIDAFLPDGVPAYQFLVDKTSKMFNGKRGHIVRTIRLRGQISQGFCVPVNELFGDELKPVLGDDVSEILGIVKYEPPIPTSLWGDIKGNFPSLWRKTDQERVQNLQDEVTAAYDNDTRFEVTIKLDGSSMSFGMSDGVATVCSRNLALKLEQEGNTFVDTFKSIPDVYEQLAAYPTLVFQGELIGSGIQKNQEKLHGHHFFLYDIFNTQTQQYLGQEDSARIAKDFNLKHVPILFEAVTLKELGFNRETLVEDILAFAEGESLTKGVKREGVVFKSQQGSFKAISNSWLLKNQD
jgi:RNA ligase (TIGR02306 family)